MEIPGREQWGNVSKDLEVTYAFELFAGLSIDQALPYFIENPIERACELRCAPFSIFEYYVFCFITFLTSPESAEASDAASVFLRLVRDMIQKYPDEFPEFFPKIEKAIDFVSDHQLFYDADVSIYGSFERLRGEIRQSIRGQ